MKSRSEPQLTALVSVHKAQAAGRVRATVAMFRLSADRAPGHRLARLNGTFSSPRAAFGAGDARIEPMRSRYFHDVPPSSIFVSHGFDLRDFRIEELNG